MQLLLPKCVNVVTFLNNCVIISSNINTPLPILNFDKHKP